MAGLTRRDAVRQAAGGAASLFAAPAIAPAVAAASDPDAGILRRAADWRRAWTALLRCAANRPLTPGRDEHDVASPHAAIARVRQALGEARDGLLAVQPRTAEGALAVLGCAATVLRARRQARHEPHRGGAVYRRALGALKWQGEIEMMRIAEQVLSRPAAARAAG
jgi:hypothetical protein